MMLKKGDTLQSVSGRSIQVGDFLTSGGQGEVYLAQDLTFGPKTVLKTFLDKFNTNETRERLRFLVKENLKGVCPVFASPVDMIDDKGVLGHCTPHVEGMSLEDFLRNPTPLGRFSEQIQLACTLAQAITSLHSRKIAHGDMHPGNFIINRSGDGVIKLHGIDLDNYSAPSLPPPPCVGQNLYIAPELRDALSKGHRAIPTIQSDLFALGVMLHEMILLAHPASGSDSSEADFHKAMLSGKWILDPAASDQPANVGGYPRTVLNADVSRLFRAAISLDGSKRPSADAWEAVLTKAFNAIFQCESCGGEFLIDSSKNRCPLCGWPFPKLMLQINGGGNIFLENSSTAIGRKELNGSLKVSMHHAIFRRIGPETWVESIGRNGIWRASRGAWIRLPDGKPMLIQHGDQLKLGDVETMVLTCSH